MTGNAPAAVVKASDIMSRQVITAAPESPVAAIAKLMLDRGIGAVPVLDDKANIVGIVSDYDLLARPPSDSPRAWWLRLFDDEAVCLEEIAKVRHLKAGDLMVRHVVTLSDQAPLGVIASLMRRRKLRHVPIVRDGKLVGIVSRGDLLDALAQQVGDPPHPEENRRMAGA